MWMHTNIVHTTPLNLGAVCETQTAGGKSSNEIKLYPNPTSGLVNIQYELTQNLRLEVKDITGRILMQILMPAGKVESTIDLTALADGVYTYNCFVGNEKKKTGKLLKY